MRASRIGPGFGHACTRACCVAVYVCVRVSCMYIMIKYIYVCVCCVVFFSNLRAGN